MKRVLFCFITTIFLTLISIHADTEKSGPKETPLDKLLKKHPECSETIKSIQDNETKLTEAQEKLKTHKEQNKIKIEVIYPQPQEGEDPAEFAKKIDKLHKEKMEELKTKDPEGFKLMAEIGGLKAENRKLYKGLKEAIKPKNKK